MDRSVDSIGSCSLDVDADSSDKSDTSDSLNFPTPISVKDITREFTANIRERCSVHTVQHNSSTAFVDPASGQVRMVITQPTSGSNGATSSSSSALPTTSTAAITSEAKLDSNPEKKPSYLNLACCVNGYSNLTTYDSKIRQDINKSREVSPIRPSSNSIQYCKKNNSLAPPVLLAMPNISKQASSVDITGKNVSVVETNKQRQTHKQNGSGKSVMLHDVVELAPMQEERRTSFIQQRVERLYGPGALAQGFYSPKKVRNCNSDRAVNTERESDNLADTELSRKFQQLSPSKDYSDFRKKITASAPHSARHHVSTVVPPNSIATEQIESHQSAATTKNNCIDLPCLRYLSQEFRAQLPTISPKRNTVATAGARSSPGRDVSIVGQSQNGTTNTLTSKTPKPNVVNHNDDANDVVDHKAMPSVVIDCEPTNPNTVSSSEQKSSNRHLASASHDINLSTATSVATTPRNQSQPLLNVVSNNSSNVAALVVECGGSSSQKDGNHFLHLLKDEQVRLLALASVAEKYIDALSNNPEISEDTFGFLRAASGKARLLVSQKMKQFEGLCHNNLNRSPEDKFPTTLDDLQGFWDMVNLQVDHIDSIFAEIEILKNNDWKKPKSVDQKSNSTKQKPNKTGPNRTIANSSNGANTVPAAMSAAALKRESQRKKLLEMKRKNRIAMVANTTTGTSNAESNEVVSSTNTVEIFISSNNNIS